MKYLFLFFLLFFSCQIVTAQEKTPKKDSIQVYKDLEKYSKKSKFRKMIYKLLFKSTVVKSPSLKNIKKKYLLKKSFDKHEGKIIRNINIETLDPFGYSVDYEDEKPKKGFERFGNAIHLKSKNWTIRNSFLFKKNDKLDSLIIKESERLIRRQRYVRSVIIKPVSVPNSKDSVDLSVRVLDSWSLIPNGTITGTKGNIEIVERNFLGLGHEYENDFGRNFSENKNAYSTRYSINNVRNTFINSSISYKNDLNDFITKTIRIERKFVSPLTRLAGGAYFEYRSFNDSLPDAINVFEIQKFKYLIKDFWFGHAFKIFSEKAEDFRATNLVTTIGYKDLNYTNKPSIIYDPTNFFSSEKLYLASVGINTSKFIEDKYLFNFDIVEDVPYGKIYSLTGGFQDKNNERRSYFGGRFAFGNYYKIGYFGANFELGSFFNGRMTEETTLRIETNFFTNLLSLGNWKIRQFIKPTIVFGNNRVPIIKDQLNLDGENGIQGFNSPLLLGTKKFLVSFQTQTYVPGNWHGFHFSPFFNFSFGVLSNKVNELFSGEVYSNLGLGVLISNDYLVFSNFQISLAFYPTIPDNGTNVFKTNSFKNSDFSIPDYQIGQPTIVPYN